MVADRIPVAIRMFDQRVVPDLAAHRRVTEKDRHHGIGIGSFDRIPVRQHLVGVIRPIGKKTARASEKVRSVPHFNSFLAKQTQGLREMHVGSLWTLGG